MIEGKENALKGNISRTKTRVIIADDHKLMREGLRSLLQKSDKVEVIGEAENGFAAVRMARELTPDIILMDISMPDLNGVEAANQIKTRNPEIKIIALSMHSDRRYINRMLKAGASGYLLKDGAFDEVEEAIQAVAANHKFISPQISDTVIGQYVQHLTNGNHIEESPLTKREREILQRIAEGGSMKEIAVGLHISVKTAETHRKNIMDKLDLHTIADLTKYAIRSGLTSLE